MREDERRHVEFEAHQADREIVERAALYLRHQAVQEFYAGLRHQEVAFGFATMLDVLASQLRKLDPFVRAEVLRACRALVGRVQKDYEEYEAKQAEAPRTVSPRRARN
jgi:hypothetical protein